MVTVLLLVSLALLFAAAASYTFQRRSHVATDAPQWLPPTHEAAGLFNNAATLRALAQEEARYADTARRQHLLDEARHGRCEVLSDASAEGDGVFYMAVFNVLLDALPQAAQRNALADFLEINLTLPVGPRLVESLTDDWQQNPVRAYVGKLLHLAARTGEAETFRRVLQTVHADTREAAAIQDLARLAESAYWLLPQPARSSGAGFALKHELAALRQTQ